jgi:hypothetical protein
VADVKDGVADEAIVLKTYKEKVGALIRYFKATCRTTKVVKNKQKEIEEKRRVEKMNTSI